MSNYELLIPIYLNQKIVFDFIAIIEDGFSQIRSIQKTESDEKSKQSNISGEIGTSNIFSLLSVKLKAGLSGIQKDSNSNVVSEEKIHTPTSLFSKLFLYLHENKILKEIKSTEHISNVSTGDFVVFKGTLKRNPIIASMESIENMMKLAFTFADDASPAQTSKKPHGKGLKNENQQLLNKISFLVGSLKLGNIIDIICNVQSENDITMVLQTDIDFFNNKNMNEIIDGEYHVLGKVIKIIKDDNMDEINLLRNTSLSSVNDNLMDTFIRAFNNNEMAEAGIDIPKVITKIKGNGMLILPIAIYT